MKQYIVNQVREYLERHWTAKQIAAKLKIDLKLVNAAIGCIK